MTDEQDTPDPETSGGGRTSKVVISAIGVAMFVWLVVQVYADRNVLP